MYYTSAYIKESVTQCHKAEVWTVLTLAAHSIRSQKNGLQERRVRILCETVLSNLYVTVQREFPVRLYCRKGPE